MKKIAPKLTGRYALMERGNISKKKKSDKGIPDPELLAVVTFGMSIAQCSELNTEKPISLAQEIKTQFDGNGKNDLRIYAQNDGATFLNAKVLERAGPVFYFSGATSNTNFKSSATNSNGIMKNNTCYYL